MELRLIGEWRLAKAVPLRPPRLCDYASWSPGNTTDGTYRLDVRRWRRAGWLSAGSIFFSHWLLEPASVVSLLVRVESINLVQLSYRVRHHTQRWQRREQAVSLIWTSCHYGGQRVWFRCPHGACRRRMAMLYFGGQTPGAFACRRCTGLRYRSESGGQRSRALQKALRIRRRLGGKESLLERFPDKPKGMRWNRYERLRQQAAQAELHSLPDPYIECAR